MEATSRISIRVTADIKIALEKEAEKLNTSLSKLVRSKLVAKHISIPKLKIDSNRVVSFNDLSKSKIIYEDIII